MISKHRYSQSDLLTDAKRRLLGKNLTLKVRDIASLNPSSRDLKSCEETVAVAGPFVAAGRATMAGRPGLPPSIASSTRPLGRPFKPGAGHYHIKPGHRRPFLYASSLSVSPFLLFLSSRDLFVGCLRPSLPRYLFTRRCLDTMVATLWKRPFKALFVARYNLKFLRDPLRDVSWDPQPSAFSSCPSFHPRALLLSHSSSPSASYHPSSSKSAAGATGCGRLLSPISSAGHARGGGWLGRQLQPLLILLQRQLNEGGVPGCVALLSHGASSEAGVNWQSIRTDKKIGAITCGKECVPHVHTVHPVMNLLTRFMNMQGTYLHPTSSGNFVIFHLTSRTVISVKYVKVFHGPSHSLTSITTFL